MAITKRWTSADLESLPDDGSRYEIIDGELFVSRQPDWHHQFVAAEARDLLQAWNRKTGVGIANTAPGLIFADDDDVAADVVWMSKARFVAALDSAGHLLVAPELVIEVQSRGRKHEFRDRVAKLALYSRRGVEEYWLVDWRQRMVTIYRRQRDELQLAATLGEQDLLESPLLPGFSHRVAELFAGLPPIA